MFLAVGIMVWTAQTAAMGATMAAAVAKMLAWTATQVTQPPDAAMAVLMVGRKVVK
tara:strand:- start:12 stop:179 length:168 start_codon:yes stop_codon:yes gene_type:complete